MQLQIFSIFALSMSGALAGCTYNGRKCFWDGSSPGCGSTSFKIGEWGHAGDELVATTEFENASEMCLRISPFSSSCCEEYGNGCWTGYKRLWCKKIGEICESGTPCNIRFILTP